MILDKLENADLYYDSVPGLEAFMKFYNDNDLEMYPPMRVKLDGDDLFINVQEIKLRQEKDCPMEAHRDYIDIQVPLSGPEDMGWRALQDCQHELQEYDEGKDMELYKDSPVSVFTVPEGYFAVFFPTDGHKPGIGEPGKSHKKLIAKTRVQQ
ncbi:MAG: YhcH/YjgK/YiaL family protein [Paludibacteraceae bacterium]|nr:YhcH/YjgK/YiaL family protein [Paludibacteraceae bacterium]